MTEVEKEIRAGGEDNYTVGLNGVAVVKNTFWEDFTIAERVGSRPAVEDTYNRCFESWKESIQYMTALAVTMNHKGWQWYNKQGDCVMSRYYFSLWEKLDAYILDGKEGGDEYEYKNFTEDEVAYYIQATD